MIRLSRFILAAAIESFASSASYAQGFPDGNYSGHMWGGNTWPSLFGHASMFVFWILVIVLIVLAVRWAVDRDRKKDPKNSALDILKERLARGEIDPAEYEERRKIIDTR